MTFYIIGFVLSLLLHMTFLAWEVANDYIDEKDILLRVKVIGFLSLLSWLALFFTVMVTIFTEKE